LLLIRERIAEECAIESPLSGEVEVDESFFGARRVKGKRGRGAGGKTIGFNMAEMSLLTASPISTESKTSGGSLKFDWPSSGDFPNPLFICILKNMSLGSIIEAITFIAS